MPADPQVGDIYRPENIPGLVFEEVTVKSTGQTVDGPRGPVEGAVMVQELLMDGTLEDKTFAPGYGEFIAFVPSADELVTVAIAVPIDSLPGPLPDELTSISNGADDIFAAVPAREWNAVSVALDDMSAGWDVYRSGGVPDLLDAQMSDALDGLIAAADARDAARACQAALDVATASLDLQLGHRSPAEIDLERMGLWARQVSLDADAAAHDAVNGDVAILETIRDRVAHTLEATAAEEVDSSLADLRAAADAGDLAGARDAAERLRATITG